MSKDETALPPTLPFDEAKVDKMTGDTYDLMTPEFRRSTYIEAARLARRFEIAARSSTSAPEVIEEVRALVVGLSEQQAMPDGWWQPRLDALLARLSAPSAIAAPSAEAVRWAGRMKHHVVESDTRAAADFILATRRTERADK